MTPEMRRDYRAKVRAKRHANRTGEKLYHGIVRLSPQAVSLLAQGKPVKSSMTHRPLLRATHTGVVAVAIAEFVRVAMRGQYAFGHRVGRSA
jgi:hypothetical protein